MYIPYYMNVFFESKEFVRFKTISFQNKNCSNLKRNGKNLCKNGLTRRNPFGIFLVDLKLSQKMWLRWAVRMLSPRSKEQNDEIREQRIHSIVVATIGVFAKKGYLGTQMEDVAKEAGLAKGLVYYYFKNKQSLFQHVFMYMMEQAINTPTQIFQDTSSVYNALQKFISFFVNSVFKEPNWTLAYWRMNEDLEKVFPDRSEEINIEFIKKFQAPLVNLFRLGMERGEIRQGNPELAATVFWCGLSGLLLYLLRNPYPPESKDAVIQQITEQLFQGVFVSQERKT
jgi:TetR/AcrR family transcriptional regulator